MPAIATTTQAATLNTVAGSCSAADPAPPVYGLTEAAGLHELMDDADAAAAVVASTGLTVPVNVDTTDFTEAEVTDGAALVH